MAQVTYRANLSAAEYPLLPELMGASVIVAGYDQNLSRYVDTNESRDLSIGIPQLYYAEDVLPTKEGIASVRYKQVGVSDIHIHAPYDVRIYTETGAQFSAHLVAVVDGGTGEYSLYLGITTTASGTEVVQHVLAGVYGAQLSDDPGEELLRPLTAAYAQGTQFVHIGGIGTFVLAFDGITAPWMRPVVLSGIEVGNVLGIVAANGYLVAFTKDSIAWSSTLQLVPDLVERNTEYIVSELVVATKYSMVGVQYKCTTAGTTAAVAPTYPTAIGATVTDGTAVFTAEALSVDFVPSFTTDAGGGVVEEVRGKIIACVRTISGFMIYTDQNIVAAVYTNNAQYPYNFRPIPNGAGISHPNCVTDAADAGWHYALTTAGVMQVASTGVKLLYPAVQDWLRSTISTKLGTGAALNTWVSGGVKSFSRISFVKSRYLCVSRGVPSGTFVPAYDEALVYDTAMDRFGQLNRAHGIITDVYPAATNVATDSALYRDPILIGDDGASWEFSPTTGRAVQGTVVEAGVAVLGRYRHARGQHIELQEVRMGALYNCNGAVSTVATIKSLDSGSTNHAGPVLYEYVAAAPSVADSYRKRFLSRVIGQDVSLVVRAPFQLNSIELLFKTGGHR